MSFSGAFQWFLQTALLPFAISLTVGMLVMLLLGRNEPILARNEGDGRPAKGWVAFLGALGVLAGALAAYVALNGWPEGMPPQQSWQWMPYITLTCVGAA